MSRVIADVSATLQVLLTNALASLDGAPQAVVHDLLNSPVGDPALTIFLYEAAEDPSARNRPRVRSSAPPDVTTRKPPLALLLRYLLTPWSGDRPTDHLILGRAMQALYDNAIISGNALQGDLATQDHTLKITLGQLSIDDRTRVWQAVQKPYRLSVAYEVRVVNVETELEDRVRAVSNRTLDPALPEAMA